MFKNSHFMIGRVRVTAALLALAILVFMGGHCVNAGIFLENTDQPTQAAVDSSYGYQITGVPFSTHLNKVALTASTQKTGTPLSDTLRGQAVAHEGTETQSVCLFPVVNWDDKTHLQSLDIDQVRHTLAIPEVGENLELLTTDVNTDADSMDNVTSNFGDVSSVLSVTASNQDVWVKSQSLEDAMDYDNVLPNYVASPSLIADVRYEITNKAALQIGTQAVQGLSYDYAMQNISGGVVSLQNRDLLASWHNGQKDLRDSSIANLDSNTLAVWIHTPQTARPTNEMENIVNLLAGGLDNDTPRDSVVMRSNTPATNHIVMLTEDELNSLIGMVFYRDLADKYAGEAGQNVPSANTLAVWLPSRFGNDRPQAQTNNSQMYDIEALLSDNSRSTSIRSGAPSVSDYVGNTRSQESDLMHSYVDDMDLRGGDGLALSTRVQQLFNNSTSPYRLNRTQRDVQDLLAGESEISTNNAFNDSSSIVMDMATPKSSGIDTGISGSGLLNAVNANDALLSSRVTAGTNGVDVANEALALRTSGNDDISIEGSSLLALDNDADSTLLASNLTSYGSTLKLANGPVLAAVTSGIDENELVATEGGALRIDAEFAQANALVDNSGLTDTMNGTEIKDGYALADSGNLNALMAIDENRIPANQMELLQGAEDAFAMLAISDGFTSSVYTGGNYNEVDLADATSDTVDALDIGSDAKVRARLNPDGSLSVVSRTATFADAIALGSRATLEILMGGSIPEGELAQLKGTDWNSLLGDEEVTFSEITFLFDDGSSISTNDLSQFVTAGDDDDNPQGGDSVLTAAVPEPGTWWLMAMGLLGLGWYSRRRKNA